MFSIFELSRKRGRPIELYRFTVRGGGPVFTYTNAERPIDFVLDEISDTYAPLPISRDSFTVSGTLDRQDMNLTVPHTSEVPELARISPPSTAISLIIFQGHAGDPDAQFLPIWNGRVTAISRKGSQATITCQSLFTSLRRQGLRRNYQYGCPHVLYGPSCRADKAPRTHPATVISTFVGLGALRNVSGAVFPLGALPADWTRMAGGTLEFVSLDGAALSLTISSAQETGGQTQVFLARPPPIELTAGLTVNLVEGCPHNMDGCNKHTSTEPVDVGLTNIHNYGGQPWIPTRNPVNQYNAFY